MGTLGPHAASDAALSFMRATEAVPRMVTVLSAMSESKYWRPPASRPGNSGERPGPRTHRRERDSVTRRCLSSDRPWIDSPERLHRYPISDCRPYRIEVDQNRAHLILIS